ncbi:MAG: NAD-dependent epimerase/dehydratase family protein [Lutibacter sp.]
MKIVITGASGYIGARLSLFLAEQGHEITAVCASKIPEKKGWTEKIAQFIVGDIRDLKVIETISNVKADTIIHLVSLDHHDSEKDPNFVSEVNVQSTWNLLNACTSKGLNKFIYFSTIHVYGKNQVGLVDEKQKATPFNAYGLTHALSEEICNYYNRKTNTNCVNIRLSNSYGEPIFPDAKCWSLIVNDLAKSAFENKKIVLKSDGSAIRDFIHFSDICNGISTLLKDSINLKEENTLHFSSAKSVSMLEVAIEVRKTYQKMYGVQIPIYINSSEEWSEEESIQKMENMVSNDLAQQQSIVFKKELTEGIKDLFTYFETELCQK